MTTPKRPMFRRWTIVRCNCHLHPQQILRIRTGDDGITRYKIGYYNAIIGRRHWVTERELIAL